mgnify:CR=1 FL=1
MENNKLIAEFMGLEIHESKHKYITTYYVTIDGVSTDLQDLQYHTSWDWLMPVIEQIDHLQHEPIQGIEDALATRCIGDTYKAVVEFIKQHNDEQ